MNSYLWQAVCTCGVFSSLSPEHKRSALMRQSCHAARGVMTTVCSQSSADDERKRAE